MYQIKSRIMIIVSKCQVVKQSVILHRAFALSFSVTMLKKGCYYH